MGNTVGAGVSSLPESVHQQPRTGDGIMLRGRLRLSNKDRRQELGNCFRVATLNVGTMKGKSAEIVETMERRRVDIACLQETRTAEGGAKLIQGKEAKYKYFWSGSDKGGQGGVGFLLSEKWISTVVGVERPSDRIIHIRLILGETIVSFVSIYAPQTGLLETDKDKFYDELLTYVAGINTSEITFVCGDFNGHIGDTTDGYDGIHGGTGFGKRNSEGERILDFAMAADLVVSNSFFKKRLSHLVTYQSGSSKS